MIDPIAKLHSPGGTLLSVYVNRRPPATRAALVDLLKPLRAVERGPAIDKSVRLDGARIVDMVARIDSDPVPAVAIFASHIDGVFEYLPLTDRVEEVASIGPRPNLRPLRAQPRPLRVGVIVADSSRARTYVMTGGGLHEVGEELSVDRGKDNYGGFAGYEEQRNRSRADEASAQLWKSAGRRLLEVHQDQPLELLVLGGHEETFEGVVSQLHPYLHVLPRTRATVDPHTLTSAELMGLVSREVDSERDRRAGELLDRLLMEAARGGEAVTGLAEVLEACNTHAVDRLVVAGPFAKPGVLCDGCGWLGRWALGCPVCGSGVFEVDDVVSAAMDATVEAGGRVDVVSVASPLDVSGVGALVRFRPM